MSTKPEQPYCVLTIGGSDSGGSAGIQADLKTFEARGVFGASAITAVTAQNTQRVTAVHPLPELFIQQQIEAVLSDINIAAIKTGLLGRASVVQLVVEVMQQHGKRPVVVDPVLVNGQGVQIVDDAVLAAYRDRLFVHAAIITPNLDEAVLLSGMQIQNRADLIEAAKCLFELGSQGVLVKGGHLADANTVVDIFYDGTTLLELTAPRLPVQNPHGVGCTLASATAAELAKGIALIESVQNAHAYLQKALAGSLGWKIGQGRTPVNHRAGQIE